MRPETPSGCVPQHYPWRARAHRRRGCLARRRNERLIAELSEPPPGAQPLEFRTRYPQPATRQFALIFWKFWQSYWRNVPYNGTRFVFAGVLALLFGSILWGVGQERRAAPRRPTCLHFL